MEAEKKLSFRQKTVTTCPVCGYEFYREELLSGGGRLIAGKLTDELRRLYEEGKKFGKVYPSAYTLTVCPSCLYSSNVKDFDALLPMEINKLALKKFFGDLTFAEERNLELGAASYMLAIDCYSFRNKKVAPTYKSAVCAIRAAWLFSDLAEKYPERPYGKISLFFYKKAFSLYVRILDIIQTGEEPTDAAGHMGPDTDKNWGYEGILYVTAVLTVKYGGQEPDLAKRIEYYEKCKRYLSRLFGVGKSSKNRPTELLDKTKDLYDIINQKLAEWTPEGTPTQEG
jgi:uncharacterized protein (DUF2225 family)